MRSDIVPGARFPDYELLDHTDTRRKLSFLQGNDPMILTLHRGIYCPKDRQQLHQLVPFARQCAVGFTRLVSITTDANLILLNDLRLGVGADWPFLYDSDRVIANDLEILIIHKIYNGYWYWGRPSVAELHQDLREVTRKIRPDWQIDTPEVREKWERGNKEAFYPYGQSWRQVFVRMAGEVDQFEETRR